MIGNTIMPKPVEPANITCARGRPDAKLFFDPQKTALAIFNTHASVRGRAPWQRRHDTIFRKARKQEYAAHQSRLHLAIVAVVEARDSEAARRAMLIHLACIRDLLDDL